MKYKYKEFLVGKYGLTSDNGNPKGTVSSYFNPIELINDLLVNQGKQSIFVIKDLSELEKLSSFVKNEQEKYKKNEESIFSGVETPSYISSGLCSRTMDLYIEFFKSIGSMGNSESKVSSTPIQELSSFSISKIIDFIKDTGLIYSPNLIKRYVCALLTKPFVILSGLAGSGKTQLALAFARAMSEDVKQQLCFIPVGSDWTNREPLLGYPNALKQGEYVLPESGALQIMLRANRNPDKPYFLVLDEMNLSYVERYFADFLSALESNEEIPLWEKKEDWNSDVDAKVKLPKNLFIIGTINVDETTYMFSPKVLDRANVIEFKISEDEMVKFLSATNNVDVKVVDGQCSDMAKDFVEKSAKKVFETDKSVNETLLDFFKVLKNVNAEFGFRSATEIRRFITNANTYAEGMEHDDILDAAIVQKLLPKLHGSRKKLEPALKALWGLCMGEDHKNDAIIRENVPNARFKESADKIQRMMQTALENGFTSFAEA